MTEQNQPTVQNAEQASAPTADQAINQQTIANPNQRKVTLEAPIKIGGTDVTEITVHKPNVRALKGVNLQELYQSNVDAVLTVLPKCTTPQLIPALHDQIDPVDLAQLAGSVIYFLVPKSQRAEMES